MKEKMKNLLQKRLLHQKCIAIAIVATALAIALMPSNSEAMVSINLSKWDDRSQVASWEAIPHEVQSKFYSDISRHMKKHKDYKVYSTHKNGYNLRYEIDFRTETVYILTITKH